MAMKSVLTLATRSVTYPLYVGLALASVSQPFCTSYLDGLSRSAGVGDLCADLSTYLGYGLLLLLALYVLASLFLWVMWREAAHEMGNVDPHEAVHGLRRGLGVRDLARTLCRESRDLGLIVGLTALFQALWLGLPLEFPDRLPLEDWGSHLKLLLPALLLVLASLTLNPLYDVVPLVAQWLKRRVLAGH